MKHDQKDEKGDDSFYVGLPNAAQVRRAVLETAKAVVLTAAAHSRVRDIQDEKLKLRTELAHLTKELRSDLERLEHLLPHRDVAPVAPSVAKHVQVKRVQDHRLDKIEAALAEIEQRMRLA